MRHGETRFGIGIEVGCIGNEMGPGVKRLLFLEKRFGNHDDMLGKTHQPLFLLVCRLALCVAHAVIASVLVDNVVDDAV